MAQMYAPIFGAGTVGVLLLIGTLISIWPVEVSNVPPVW